MTDGKAKVEAAKARAAGRGIFRAVEHIKGAPAGSSAVVAAAVSTVLDDLDAERGKSSRGGNTRAQNARAVRRVLRRIASLIRRPGETWTSVAQRLARDGIDPALAGARLAGKVRRAKLLGRCSAKADFRHLEDGPDRARREMQLANNILARRR